MPTQLPVIQLQTPLRLHFNLQQKSSWHIHDDEPRLHIIILNTLYTEGYSDLSETKISISEGIIQSSRIATICKNPQGIRVFLRRMRITDKEIVARHDASVGADVSSQHYKRLTFLRTTQPPVLFSQLLPCKYSTVS
jgi:hypothetical protein